MSKYVDVSYRPVDVEIPKIVQDFFSYIEPGLSYETLNFKRGTFRKSPCNATICGGMTRDLLFKTPFNDMDLISPASEEILKTELYGSSGKIEVLEEEGESNPHHIFSSNDQKIKLHWIDQYMRLEDEDDSDVIIPPCLFDFTINEIHLNNKGQWYATPKTWFDYDNRILRANNGRHFTSAVAIRAIRLAAKCNLRIDEKTLKLIVLKFRANYINEKIILKHLRKTLSDDTNDIVFDWLKKVDYPEIRKYSNLSDMIDGIQEKVDVSNYIEEEPESRDYLI